MEKFNLTVRRKIMVAKEVAGESSTLKIWSFKGKYKTLHLSWFAFFLSFLVWFNMAPFASTIQKALGLT
ncbi:MAG: hypothetical protein ACI86H_001967, partial [bacterium]